MEKKVNNDEKESEHN